LLSIHPFTTLSCFGQQCSIDIGVSTSLDSLNLNTASLSASTGIAVNKPVFDSDVAECCLYDFAGYIFGKSDPNSTSIVNDPDGKPADIQKSGPMYVGFLADPVPDAAGLSCGGVPTWWQQVYNLPDVGLNHPARWQWDKSSQTVSFNAADRSGTVSPLDQPFYQMKGFFVTKATDGGNGPNLTEAAAGDQLTLTTRVYNFSLVDTNSPALQQPAQSIHVRFYGQYYCSSGSSTEQSCINPAGNTCQAGNLCGNGFAIGETTLGSIPGFKSSSTQENSPNWTTANMNFDTTAYGNTFLVFWVVVWMEDAKNKLVAEMPDHGLTANPASVTIQQITDVPVSPYSNNVGMYGVNSPFFIAAPAAPGATETNSGSVARIALAGAPQVLLGHMEKITARFDAAGGSVGRFTIAYYDGKPGSGGKLLDVQRVPRINSASTYQHRILFHADACGDHTLFAEAFGPGISPFTSQSASVHVSLHPIAAVQALATNTTAAGIEDNRLRGRLLDLLHTALGDFRQFRNQPGDEALRSYVEALSAARGNTISADKANRLLAEAGVIFDCNSKATPPLLVVNQTLTRDAQGHVVANVVLANNGGSTAGNTLVTVARIGSGPAALIHSDPTNIFAGSSASLKLTFPASVGDSGRNTTLTVGGTYAGGSFHFTSRITLP